MARVIGGSTIGKDCLLDPDVVIGYPDGNELSLLSSDREAEISGATVGNNCTLRAGTLYSRARLGSSVRSGHGWLVREDSTVGDGSLIGTGVTIDNDCRVGDHCSLQTGVYIPTGSRIGDRCFLGPNATLTNDRTPLRTDYQLEAVTLEDDVTVGANATLMPGITIGEGAFIAGGAVVTRDVPAWKMAMGVPAQIMELPENLKKPNRLGD